MEHFGKHVKPIVENAAMFLLNNHSSHVNVVAIDFCQKNGILVITHHLHTNHNMQLLDRIVFGPHHEDPSLHELMGKVYTNAFTTSNIPKGFEGSGLYPVNGEDEL